ncbi:DEBR0S2_12530g1_1 [Brettanomyces bruxellensis]|uniref:DEBR0S2_12530g1_1 n=1 Tax=Dekkera bruxellensis TaxID=5007 RepID=A0A7D9GYV7_DEKBR|nr:DEBR0S2_12530g1_1 [Brettanomyces bruxellensis]
MSQRGLQIFSSLPPELQFQVLKRCNVESLKSFMVINENYRIYCDSAIRENLESIFSNHQFELSIFTPQQENIRAELYKTKCCTEIGSRNIGMESQEVLQKYDKKGNVRYHDSYLYGLQLTGTRDVLSDKTFKAEKGEQKTNTNNQVESEQPFIHLVISEGVKYIQLHLSLYARSIDASTPTLETHGTIVLNEEDKYQKGILSLSGGKFNVEYTLESEGEIPPRSPYDYDVVYGYKLKLSEFRIDNMHLFEGISSLHQ